MNALIDYSRAYEKAKPSLNVSVSLDEKQLGTASFNDYRDEAVTYNRSINATDLGMNKTVVIDRDGTGRLY